ncbi:hypothetical protein C8R45DRAFT_951879 [Mycena sanguinolenta]|nr:hypothetical protein C8R45DRAFT_951879 [Mycena sanguinolenta]
MSLHEFESRAGLGETMVLHFSHESSHSLPATTTLGYIVVPKPDRLPLAAKSNNVEYQPIPRRSNKPAKLSAGAHRDVCLAMSSPRPYTPEKDIESDVPLAVSLSRPCTPFQPLPPVPATSPLRLSSFLDDILPHSLHNGPNAPSPPPSPKSESPLPQPLFPQLSIEIPSVSHPNSPYVPWSSPVRRNILRPLTPSSQVSRYSRYSRPYSRSGARAPEPQEPDSPPAHNHNRFLRLSRSFKNLGRTVKRSVKHVKNALRKTSKARSPEVVAEVVVPEIHSPIPPSLPSPVESSESSNTNTLAEWLQECEAKVQRATPHFMTLEEYEERGSWIDLTTEHDESEIHSPPISDDVSEHFLAMSPTCTPMSPACPGTLFPHLSMHDIWPTPPRYIPQARGCSYAGEREMSMPGGWNSGLRDSPYNDLQ